jgi:hypothetical protein
MKSSARSSVTINLRYVCRPVAASLQEFPTSGFYGEFSHAVIDAMSTASGQCLKPKTSPTVARIASRICAESSLFTARLSSCDIAAIAKKVSSVPLFGAASVAPFFRGDT